MTVLTLLLLGIAAVPASASLKQDLQRFSNCPYTNPTVNKCVYSVTTSGEFVIGKSAVPISKPVVIQVGLDGLGFFVPPTNGEALSRTPLPVPGGLVGIELPGNFTEVTATAELAGQGQLGSTIVLPLKVKLDNLALGGNCYIGGDTEPLTLHLVYGATNPPPPNKPITGSLQVVTKDKDILALEGTIVDNAFAAPGATSCTPLPPVGDLAVDVKEGLPAAAGTNTAIMNGTTEEVAARIVQRGLALPALGRCRQVEPVIESGRRTFHGAYRNSKCTEESSEGLGKFEWAPGPGPNARFSGTGKTLTLETAGNGLLTCSASKAEGEYIGAKTQKLVLTLTGCQLGPKGKAVSCQSLSASPGEVRTSALEGGLDFVKENEEPAIPEVGSDLRPASGTSIATFECGERAMSLGGSVIVPVSALDTLTPSFKYKAVSSGVNQSPEQFEGGLKDVPSLDSGSGAEPVGLKTTETITNGEPLEIKAVL